MMNAHSFVIKCLKMIVSHSQINPPHLPLPKGGLPPRASRLALLAPILPTVMIAAVLALAACSRPPDEQQKVEPKAEQRSDKITVSAETQTRFGFTTAKPQRITPVRLIEDR